MKLWRYFLFFNSTFDCVKYFFLSECLTLSLILEEETSFFMKPTNVVSFLNFISIQVIFLQAQSIKIMYTACRHKCFTFNWNQKMANECPYMFSILLFYFLLIWFEHFTFKLLIDILHTSFGIIHRVDLRKTN